MKYRIKIITYQNGRKTYSPQFKKWWGWTGLFLDGSEFGLFLREYDKRDHALTAIDSHFAGNSRKQIIEFEYINK